MRKQRQEITDHAVLEEILAGAVICRLAMNDGDMPYLLPFNYGYRKGCMYIHAAPEGKKIDLWRMDPRVMFEVEEGVEITTGERACQWSTRYRCVTGYGHVEIVEDEAGKREGLEVIMARHGAPHLLDFEPGNLQRMVILKVRIASMTGKQSSNWDRK